MSAQVYTSAVGRVQATIGITSVVDDGNSGRSGLLAAWQHMQTVYIELVMRVLCNMSLDGNTHMQHYVKGA